MSLIPRGRGFVRHPKLAKVEKSVSVFHELHCLVSLHSLLCCCNTNKTKHNIRTAYFTYAYLLSKSHNATTHSLESRAANSIVLDYFVDPFVSNPFIDKQLKSPTYADSLRGNHIKHCFDYLRQALICAADSNLEDIIIINGTSATTGMGSSRICRNFDALKGWSETWRSSDNDGIV
jgi:hypothetical protein